MTPKFMQKVFIVEDDDNIREMVLYALSSAGFEAEGFTCSGAFYARLLKEAPSLVLLDIMLPGEDGISILKKLKQAEKTKRLPVIMLTAKGAELDRIKGLDLGADDYITKPFSVMEAISRVKAVLRRCEGSESDAEKPVKVTVGSVTLHSDRRVVFAGNEEIVLTYREFELLYYLMHNKGIVLRRDTLLNQVWGFDYSGETRTVDMHIKSLRKKMGSAGKIIKTVRNVGYKIEG
ncbi:DNA-binding response regulator [Spirochaetia bacterium]|nr:DNA-binding response regulator [Spirochaetia bacterium]